MDRLMSMRNTKVILNMSCSDHSIQGEGEQGEECHGAHFMNSEFLIPLDPSLTPNPLSLCIRAKEPQTTVIHAFIQHAEPVMTYTDDARTASPNVEHHHGL